MKLNQKQLAEVSKMMSGDLYDANCNDELLALLDATHERLHQLNLLRPSQVQEQRELLRSLLGTVGERFKVIQPFFCDYGFNIHLGEDFFANTHLVILDEAPVTFGDHVFIGPNCSFYTAGHPLDVEQRNRGLEYARPITVGHNVWLGGNVTVVSGVSIGDGCVIGAGSVVTRDIAPHTLAAGNPCRPLRRI